MIKCRLNGYELMHQSACLVSDLLNIIVPGQVACFFFCRFDDEESLQARTIIRSIVRQMLSELPADAFKDVKLSNTPGISVIDLLEAFSNLASQYFVVLDGLDDCEEAQVKELVEILQGLLMSTKLRVKIFWSSRPTIRPWMPEKVLAEQHIRLEDKEIQKKVAHDIHKLIHVSLEVWLEEDPPQLQIDDPTLILTIVDHLEKNAQGMYANMYLQI